MCLHKGPCVDFGLFEYDFKIVYTVYGHSIKTWNTNGLSSVLCLLRLYLKSIISIAWTELKKAKLDLWDMKVKGCSSVHSRGDRIKCSEGTKRVSFGSMNVSLWSAFPGVHSTNNVPFTQKSRDWVKDQNCPTQKHHTTMPTLFLYNQLCDSPLGGLTSGSIFGNDVFGCAWSCVVSADGAV